MEPKDSEETMFFMAAFSRLKELIEYDPTDLEAMADGDESVWDACVKVGDAAQPFLSLAAGSRQAFADPVNPAFTRQWREYEARYADPVGTIVLADLLGAKAVDFKRDDTANDPLRRWKDADTFAIDSAQSIKKVVGFASDMAERGFGGGDVTDEVADGVRAWETLSSTAGQDLRGIFRRRQLVPFVNIPRHVSYREGADRLKDYLQQAHDAFIFGLPSAALAMMRTLLEIVLVGHYGASGGKLEDLINTARGLDANRKRVLHRLRKLANGVVHVKDTSGNDDRDDFDRLPSGAERVEIKLASCLATLRELIEEASSSRQPR